MEELAQALGTLDRDAPEPVRKATKKMTVPAHESSCNLTWNHAQHSIAKRANLIDTRSVEVVVFAKEPHAPDTVNVFIDGRPITAPTPVKVTTHVVHLDYDDEEDGWLIHALDRIGHLSPAAQQQVAAVITRIAGERGLDLNDLREECATT